MLCLWQSSMHHHVSNSEPMHWGGAAPRRAEEQLSYGEIQARANLPDEDVIRILHSLACGKYRILAKEPPGKTINRADVFSINRAFTDRMRRIKVRCCPPWRADVSSCTGGAAWSPFMHHLPDMVCLGMSSCHRLLPLQV